MAADIRLIEKVCRDFCSYYKPSKDEELACRGFTVIERLILRGMEIVPEKSARHFHSVQFRDNDIGRGLIRKVCQKCPFYEKDCDFAEEKAGALPCGGFILLAHLIESAMIGIDDIENIN